MYSIDTTGYITLIYNASDFFETRKYPSPYFPSLHLVHRHNSMLKTFCSLSATRLSLDPAALEQRTFLSACGFFRNELPRQSAVVFACIVYRVAKVESRAREPFGERDTALSSIPLRIEFESKAPHPEADEPASQPTNLN